MKPFWQLICVMPLQRGGWKGFVALRWYSCRHATSLPEGGANPQTRPPDPGASDKVTPPPRASGDRPQTGGTPTQGHCTCVDGARQQVAQLVEIKKSKEKVLFCLKKIHLCRKLKQIQCDPKNPFVSYIYQPLLLLHSSHLNVHINNHSDSMTLVFAMLVDSILSARPHLYFYSTINGIWQDYWLTRTFFCQGGDDKVFKGAVRIRPSVWFGRSLEAG